MEELRAQDGETVRAQEIFLGRMGVESVGGSGGVRVKEFAMAGGSANWYNYQLHVREGTRQVVVYREDREGLHCIQGGVMVMTLWGGDEEVVVIGKGAELEEFVRKCDAFKPPIEYVLLDDPSLLFPD